MVPRCDVVRLLRCQPSRTPRSMHSVLERVILPQQILVLVVTLIQYSNLLQLCMRQQERGSGSLRVVWKWSDNGVPALHSAEIRSIELLQLLSLLQVLGGHWKLVVLQHCVGDLLALSAPFLSIDEFQCLL